MDAYIEPYAKENNLLQLSLYYFGKGRPKKTLVEWADTEGEYHLECNCKYGVPGSFDQDVYTGCMRIWVKKGMPVGSIKLNYSDIARELGLLPRDWNGKIKKSLKRLAQARYELNKCFIKADKNGNKKISTHFSLFDTASLFEHEKGKSKRHSESELVFPGIIRENLEAKYYQLLDMAWYRSLPEGLPRRLYEYLAKRRYQNINGSFVISEVALCRWLPIMDKHTTNRRKRLANLAQHLIAAGFLRDYLFDRKKKICVFTYEMNATPKLDELVISKKLQLPEKTANEKAKEDASTDSVSSQVGVEATQCLGTEEQLQFVEALEWINSIPYFHKKRKKEIAALPMSHVIHVYPKIKAQYQEMCRTSKAPASAVVYQAFMRETPMGAKICKPDRENRYQLSFFNEDNDSGEMSALIAMLKTKKCSAKLKRDISRNYRQHGYEYVKWNILYANQNAKKNYATYLRKSLAQNWAEEWAQEEKERLERGKQVKCMPIEKSQKQSRQRRKKELAEKQKSDFLQKTRQLDKETLHSLWEQAKNTTPANLRRRQMNIKIRYSKLLLEYFISRGENFAETLLNQLDFVFIKQLTKELDE